MRGPLLEVFFAKEAEKQGLAGGREVESGQPLPSEAPQCVGVQWRPWMLPTRRRSRSQS